MIVKKFVLLYIARTNKINSIQFINYGNFLWFQTFTQLVFNGNSLSASIHSLTRIRILSITSRPFIA